MSTGKKRAPFGKIRQRKTHQLLNKTTNLTDLNTVEALTNLELLLCKRLQISVNQLELLTIFQDTVPKQIGLHSLKFTPAFQAAATDDPPFSGHIQKLKLYAGNKYVGQLQLHFMFIPEPDISELLENIASLLAFPLQHALTLEKAIKHSEQDTLTGLKNRNAMNHSIATASDAAKRYGFPISVLMLDIDYFKRINDTYGHLTGDEVLQKLANIVQQSCRLADQAFRFGGEEFLMLLQNTDQNGALETAERLRKAVEMNDFAGLIEEKELPITVSIGISCFHLDDTQDSLIARADQALYKAKRNGRNRCVVIQPEL